MADESAHKTQSLCTRVYRALLWVYPREHRREYGTWMVQLFADMVRETRPRGVLAMMGLWLSTLADLISSACRERVSAWKGQMMVTADLASDPVPWPQVMLAIVPGLCATLVTNGWFSSLFKAERVWLVRLVCLLTTCILILALGVRRRRIAVWSLPALGLLSAAALLPFTFALFLPSGRQGQLVLMMLPSTLLLGAFVLRWRRFSAKERIGLGAVLLLCAALCLFYRSVYALTDLWLTVWPAVYLIQHLVPVAVGTLLADRYGIRTCVLVLPALHLIGAAALYSSAIAVASPSYLVTCCYTVVSVIWMLRARSNRSQVLGLFVPWLVAVVLILGYHFPDGLVARAIGQAVASSVLALSVLLYDQAYTRRIERSVERLDLAAS